MPDSIHDVLERALFSNNGVALTLSSKIEARRWRLRAYAFRYAQRKLNVAAGGERTCEFDALILRINGNKILIAMPETLEIKEL